MKNRLSYNEQLKDIYAQIPNIDCKKKCHASCGIIPVERPELKKIRKKASIDVEPFLIHTPQVTMMFDAEKERCPLLTEDNLCSVHDVRPFICRLFGVVQGMSCPEGCKPDRYLSDTEVSKLINQLKQLK